MRWRWVSNAIRFIPLQLRTQIFVFDKRREKNTLFLISKCQKVSNDLLWSAFRDTFIVDVSCVSIWAHKSRLHPRFYDNDNGNEESTHSHAHILYKSYKLIRCCHLLVTLCTTEWFLFKNESTYLVVWVWVCVWIRECLEYNSSKKSYSPCTIFIYLTLTRRVILFLLFHLFSSLHLSLPCSLSLQCLWTCAQNAITFSLVKGRQQQQQY